MYSQEKTCALEEVCPFGHSSTSAHELILLQIHICKPETIPLCIKCCSHKAHANTNNIQQPLSVLITSFLSHLLLAESTSLAALPFVA